VRQFLVMRGTNGLLRSVLIFDEGEENLALKAYERAEERGVECVLLGADRLSTAIRTHSVWFDEAPDVVPW
jgi:hypothetical protein